MNILNLFKRNTEDSEPLLLDDLEDEELSEELATIRREALSDPLYFSKLVDPANSTWSATATENDDDFPHPHDEPFDVPPVVDDD